MSYSGRYKVSNPKKYKGDYTNVIYRSLWEKSAFKWCDQNPNVKSWCSEEVVIPYLYEVDQKYHRYFMDLKITIDNRTILVEIKPESQTVPPTGQRRTKRYLSESLEYVKNRCKWKAASNYAKDRGWEFQIWTENTLQKMGILPKPSPGRLKKLKPLPRFKRKSKK